MAGSLTRQEVTRSEKERMAEGEEEVRRMVRSVALLWSTERGREDARGRTVRSKSARMDSAIARREGFSTKGSSSRKESALATSRRCRRAVPGCAKDASAFDIRPTNPPTARRSAGACSPGRSDSSAAISPSTHVITRTAYLRLHSPGGAPSRGGSPMNAQSAPAVVVTGAGAGTPWAFRWRMAADCAARSAGFWDATPLWILRT
mmetsp:Transcript_167/g.469  ORF Transcript_167/g.469 Transcript_167/m.469 type:complete len:205 (-) Transcript_167:904-1518(-)